MRTLRFLAASFLVLALPAASSAATLPPAARTSTVFIVNYSDAKEFLGWGSGFFVDEGIVVTNKHVLAGGDWHAVYATGPDGRVDTSCRKNITKSDVKVNLDDDVAYMRVYLDCDHDVLDFAPDPDEGDPLWIVGFPYRGSTAASMDILVTSGSVLPTTIEGWMRTDARLDFGNSGGPVVNESAVIGVAVAKGVDADGNFVSGYFIPSSVILRGLLYANDSRFGYSGSEPAWLRSSSSSSRSSSSRAPSSSSSSVRSASSRSSVSISSRSSLRPTSSSLSSRRPIDPFEERTCERVGRWFAGDAVMLGRVNRRLLNRFGFVCPG